MAKLRNLARSVLRAEANVEERRESGSRVYVLSNPSRGELMRGRTLMELYERLQSSE